MPNPERKPSGLSRLWWLMAIKVLLLALAVYVALRLYHLV